MSAEYPFGFSEPAPYFRPAPAGDTAERLARLRLVRSRRVGPATYLRLMGEHGHALAALEALPDVARSAGVHDYRPCPIEVVEAEMRAGQRHRAKLICLGDPDYPQALADIPDPPPVLWARGDIALLNRPIIAVVGTRNASALGTRMARRLSKALGEAGLVVVSGLARGIDTLAHRASLPTGTIAVQAGGLDSVYPAENTGLANDIMAEGLCLSEMPFGLSPQARHFPQRNRIVSGLSRAVVVVEAALRSGSMITARAALDQGREVMAVPGHPLDSRAGGCNQLIRDGAVLVRDVDDILEALGSLQDTAPRQSALPLAAAEPAPPMPQEAAGASDGGLEGAILAYLGPQPVPEDLLIRDLAAPARAVGQALAILEMAGRVTRSAGGMVAKL